MLLRPSILPLLRGKRLFTSTASRNDTSPYEILAVPVTATAAEIKKSFYALSKTHHPDRNPNDPEASSRFVKISDAYNILGHPDTRKKWDREHLSRARSDSSYTPTGSYASTGPGGRPASGLSKRRTRFHGPPPSFYRSGGWGEHSAKRSAAAEETANNARAQTDHHNETGQTATGQEGGGMGFGQHPFGDPGDVPHFDREGHLRTHSQQEARRQSRSRRSQVPLELPPGMFVNFLTICGILGVGVLISSLIIDRVSGSGSRREKKGQREQKV